MFNRISASIIAALALSACGTPDDTMVEGHEAPLHQARSAAISGFTVDTHLLEEQIPAESLPSQPLEAEAFEVSAIQARLGGFDEPLKDRGSFASRLSLSAPSWFVEVDESRGLVSVHSRLKKKGQADLSPRALKKMSLARLERWGVHGDAVARILQRKLMKQDRTVEGELKAPTLHRHKTYVYRGVGGIQVEGHRAVITHHPDGSFHRASVAWPPLASSGHQLQTKLDTKSIVERALERIRAEGEEAGEVTLRWGYVPTAHENGEVTLELHAIARIVGVSHDDHGTEDRVFEIPVDAR